MISFHYNDTLLYNARYIATSPKGGAASQLPYTSEYSTGVITTGASVYLPIVPVIANGSSRPVHALLYSGSTNTFVTKQLAQALHLQGKYVGYVDMWDSFVGNEELSLEMAYILVERGLPFLLRDCQGRLPVAWVKYDI